MHACVRVTRVCLGICSLLVLRLSATRSRHLVKLLVIIIAVHSCAAHDTPTVTNQHLLRDCTYTGNGIKSSVTILVDALTWSNHTVHDTTVVDQPGRYTLAGRSPTLLRYNDWNHATFTPDNSTRDTSP